MSEWAAINLAECHSTVNGFEGMVRLSNIQWCCWDEFCFIAFGAEGCRVISKLLDQFSPCQPRNIYD